MRFAYIGNHSTPHSTESHVALALENNGHTVVRIQEAAKTWRWMGTSVAAAECDAVLWTTTYDFAPPDTFPEQRTWLAACPVPVIGYHLDLWWGLDRESRVWESPFFRCDLVCTADGGHPDQWEQAGVRHCWFPPGVSAAECEPGTYRDELASALLFVGSWQGGYHAESRHRHELVEWLRKRGCRFVPAKGQPALRGAALRDLYASAKVVVGDSCMVPNLPCYWSDRIPETCGRGAFLLHPNVEGLDRHHPHLVTWEAFDWGEADRLVDRYLADGDAREQVAILNRDHVLSFHTYEVRMRQLVETMHTHGLLSGVAA